MENKQAEKENMVNISEQGIREKGENLGKRLRRKGRKVGWR